MNSIESEIDWSRETVMQLIDQYREQPVLWNPMDPDYKNKNLKNYAWNDISREIKASNSEVQAKVKTLLAQFQRELKKKKSGSGADEYKSKWCYFKAMLFLKDKTTARKIKEAGIATDDKEAADETVQDASIQETEELVGLDDNSPLLLVVQDGGYNKNDSPSVAHLASTTTNRRKPAVTQHSSDLQVKEIFKNLNGAFKAQREEDECDLYAKLLAKKLRRMSERDREIVMYEIDGVFIKRYERLAQAQANRRRTSSLQTVLDSNQLHEVTISTEEDLHDLNEDDIEC